jgi:hypothetical protein
MSAVPSKSDIGVGRTHVCDGSNSGREHRSGAPDKATDGCSVVLRTNTLKLLAVHSHDSLSIRPVRTE